MDREQILKVLREHQPELKAAGLLHLRLFGSTVRGDGAANSDVDLLYEFDPTRTYTLLDLGRFQYQLTDLCGTQGDLASADRLKPAIRERILQEAVVAF